MKTIKYKGFELKRVDDLRGFFVDIYKDEIFIGREWTLKAAKNIVDVKVSASVVR